MSNHGKMRAAIPRGSRLMMTESERDVFLANELTCRVATVDETGQPHVSPLWFVWDGACVWLCSLHASKRFANLLASPVVALVVDAGQRYDELRGIELRGRATVVGEAPWSGVVTPELRLPDRLFSEKYPAQGGVRRHGRHAWVRVTPEVISSWDFRKGSRSG
jgi:hypothetical protein